MGMAASQARYLALVARKSNCEYEGQQINQARLVLSNQSANLFNQMLGLSVPVPPSTQDFTKKQYSFTDGISKYTIDKWNQLAEPDSDGYNYVVTYHYKSDVYTGYQKQKSDPQVQFSIPGAYPDSSTYTSQIKAIQSALLYIADCQEAYEAKQTAYKTLASKAAQLSTYADNKTSANVINCTLSEDKTYYTVQTQTKTFDDVVNIEFLNYSDVEPPEGQSPADADVFYYNGDYYRLKDTSKTTLLERYEKIARPDKLYALFEEKKYYKYQNSSTNPNVSKAIDDLKAAGALDKDFDINTVFYADDNIFAFGTDLDACEKGTKSILPLYYYNDKESSKDKDNIKTVKEMQDELAVAQNELNAAKAMLDVAQATYDAMNVPSYIGNAELTPISKITDTQLAEIKQIIADMDDEEIVTKIKDCFNTFDETYSNDTYIGGLYTFTQGGKTYIATYYDMADAINNGEGINHIDNQPKLAYYGAEYINKNIDKTSKALLETDSEGRFTSVRFADDSIEYPLDVETITDDVAYKDAMNKYYYENAQYEKLVQDLNAKTSLIQQEDKELELRLKQLDTEQNALATEMEAVHKVVKDNVDKSFKTFNG